MTDNKHPHKPMGCIGLGKEKNPLMPCIGLGNKHPWHALASASHSITVKDYEGGGGLAISDLDYQAEQYCSQALPSLSL